MKWPLRKRSIPFAWKGLTHQPLRLLAAIAGIAFSAILMFVQLGFKDALLLSAGVQINRMNADLALISPQYEYMVASKVFPQRRLYQTLAVDGVESVNSLYCALAPWRNPWTRRESMIFMMAFRPRPDVVDLGGANDLLEQLRIGDNVLFDSLSRPEFGPVATELASNRHVTAEISGNRVEVVGTFSQGTSFGADGTVIMSDRNYFRILPYLNPEAVNIGLIKLKPGYDPETVRAKIAQLLPKDVLVLTHSGLVAREREHWETSTPIGFIINSGVLLGLVVGCIIVYQILYTDVTDHLGEYATLKAMGYHDRALSNIVIQESAILSLFGFLPGVGLSMLVYAIAGHATHLPVKMTLLRLVVVYFLTAVMCMISGSLAMRKLRSADPAEIF
jgi:putative ABC transport system permease protein